MNHASSRRLLPGRLADVWAQAIDVVPQRRDGVVLERDLVEDRGRQPTRPHDEEKGQPRAEVQRVIGRLEDVRDRLVGGGLGQERYLPAKIG